MLNKITADKNIEIGPNTNNKYKIVTNLFSSVSQRA